MLSRAKSRLDRLQQAAACIALTMVKAMFDPGGRLQDEPSVRHAKAEHMFTRGWKTIAPFTAFARSTSLRITRVQHITCYWVIVITLILTRCTWVQKRKERRKKEKTTPFRREKSPDSSWSRASLWQGIRGLELALSGSCLGCSVSGYICRTAGCDCLVIAELVLGRSTAEACPAEVRKYAPSFGSGCS